MNQPVVQVAHETEEEYRTIEAALLESARGRWFLSEHGRRARRLDSALLEDAIGRLQTSLRQPPALLGQLRAEIEKLSDMVAETRAELLRKPASVPVDELGVAGMADVPAPRKILMAAEAMHELAWSLQANAFDPDRCEAIARHASAIAAISQQHAYESERVLALANALDSTRGKLDAVLATILNEMQTDQAG